MDNLIENFKGNRMALSPDFYLLYFWDVFILIEEGKKF